MPHAKTNAYSGDMVARKLDNGVTLTLERLPYLHSATAGVWVRTGSANERKSQCGISHFLEHLFFKGTSSRTARQITEAIESKGGHLNAFTAREYTCVYARTLDEHVATGIEILADVIKNSTFRDLDKERNVILEEIAAIEDVPEDHSHDLLARRMWPNHSLGRSVSGEIATVAKISIDDVRAYYDGWYRPRNVYFSIAGNFDPDAIVDQVYAELTALVPRALRKRYRAPQFQPGIELVERDVAQNHLCVGFRAPTVTDPRRYAYDLLCCALGGGSTSRLFQRIREDEGLAYAVYSFPSAYLNAGALNVYAAVAPENLERTAALSFEEIRRLRDETMADEELDMNREQLKGNMLMSLEGTFNRMARMAKSMMYYNRLLTIDEVIAGLDAVTVADVQALARELFQPDCCAMLVLGPAKGAPIQDIPL